jgi:dTDP-4-amino-4,6-dideoxygalactose transaminase
MSEPSPTSMTSNLRRVPLCEPCLGGNERAYLDECLTSGYVSSVGPFVERFEQAFADRVGAQHAVACASGTAALHLACRLAGVTRGDEVFVATLTFVASANPIRYEHAQAVLIDAEAETWNLDPALIVTELDRRAAAGRRQPRAVIAVHILGMPARLDELAEACARHGVTLIEDAAEALGAHYTQGPFAGKSVGTVGHIGAFSFNGNKIITAGGGGMVTTNDPALARRAKHLSTQARLPGAEYRHDEVGYNYRLTNIAAALGLAQLEQLDEFLACKRAIADRYDDAFVDLPGFSRPQRVAWGESSHWLYAVSIDETLTGINREALATTLSERGIDSRPIWTPLHLQAPYNQAPRLGGSVSERLFRGGLCFPSSVGLTVAEQDRVIAAVRTSTRGL